MTAGNEIGDAPSHPRQAGRVIRRHGLATRLTHWTWAVALFFLLLSGLQIFNAHPSLYIGQQSGFAFENAILEIGAVRGMTANRWASPGSSAEASSRAVFSA